MKTCMKDSTGILKSLKANFGSDEPLPKYYQLKRLLKSRILNGELKNDDRLPSAHMLAKKLDITRVTVDRALNELEKENLVRRVQGNGTFVDRTSSLLASNEIVGMIVATTGHLYENFSSHLIRGLMRHDLFPLIVDNSEEKDRERKVRMLIEKKPACLVLDTSVILKVDKPLIFSLLSRYKGQIVFIHRFEGDGVPPPPVANYVLSDVRKGGMLAAEHLIAEGYRRIVHYMPRSPHMPPNPQTRSMLIVAEGIRAAIKKHGLPEESFSSWLEEGWESLEKRMDKEPGPVAVIAYADYGLQDWYQLAEKRGLNIPGDCALIGWNNTPWCDIFRPRTTSLSIREDLLAQETIRIIANPSVRGKTILIPPELVIRESSGCASNRKADG